MPRRKSTTSATELDMAGNELPGLDGLAGDPPPVPTSRGRKPRVAAGTRGKIPARTSGGRIASKAQMVAGVRAELEMYLTLAVGTWSLRDPDCAGAATPERIATMADALTDMIARNDTLLTKVASSGILGDIVRLLAAGMPIAKTIWAAHGPGGHGHKTEGDGGDLYAQYPAYAAHTG